MTSKAETTFANGVHKLLPPAVYAEKMHNPFRGGTPDFYIEGPASTVWIEYKFIALPKRDSTLIVPNLSALQQDWLQRNYDNGYAPRVIVGCRVGRQACGAIFNHPTTWTKGVTCEVFKRSLQLPGALAISIKDLVS